MISRNFEQFYSELEEVLKNPRPWAHMRYGDGEGIVMGYPKFNSEKKAQARWGKWLGHFNIDMIAFGELVRESVQYSDIVGIPCQRHQTVNQDWRNVQIFMSRYNLLEPETKICCMDCTIDLQRQDLYPSLFKYTKEVNYISCRDVTDKLKKAFGFEKVNAYHLPPQHRPCKGDVLTKRLHFPDLFFKYYSMLNQDQTNKLWLVGAGGLGKIYCMQIKKSGGIAIDVGSNFDGWAGLVTRSHLRDIKRFMI